jgi:restriction endonuclease Mrr
MPNQPKNQLFYGDNLEVLRRHIKDESVDLCYIDPPFNSKRNYNQIYNNIGKEDQAQAQAFIDTWTWDDIANQGLAEIQENYLGHFTSQSIDLISGLAKVLGKGSLLAYRVSTYSNNRATINQKKGADKGIDGIAYFRSEKDDPEKIILQVKSGKVKSGDIRDLQGTMTRESAVLGVFITLQKPTKDMLKEAKEAGIYQSQYMSAPVDKIRIVTVQEIIEEQKRLEILLALEVLKSAEKQMEVKQGTLDFE